MVQFGHVQPTLGRIGWKLVNPVDLPLSTNLADERLRV